MKSWGILAVLLTLAVVPLVAHLVFSGKNEDVVYGAYGEEEIEEEIAPSAGPSAAPTPGAPKAQIRRTPVPLFKGFADARYQRHDRLIARLVEEFNRKRRAWAGATAVQSAQIPPLTAAQVKAQMIQESGGGDAASRAAWAKDPLQVNVPGDWNKYKRYLGLREPTRRNEGTVEKNLRAGIMYLSRKGFGQSGQPAANRPSAAFDGWKSALMRYNGRLAQTGEGVTYCTSYANRILRRATKGVTELVPIEIPKQKKK